ncbi:hypothetical protein ACFZAG_19845 [Streptomyces sp. NPDC012403]|uniref:hypothetical protein n=1 Tax=Streptomyces sp. NPDC012403 TaxID=3364831 RepID=UPI0036EF445F
MGNERRVRRLVVNGTVWHWTVRQRARPDYPDCRVTLSLFPEAPAHGVRRRLSLVFAPGPDRVVSNAYVEAGTVVRLPDHAWLNLYEPGTVRRLLDAAAPARRRGACSTPRRLLWRAHHRCGTSKWTAGPTSPKSWTGR